MAGQVFLPKGTVVRIDSTPISELRTITPPSRTKGEAETTANDAEYVRTFIPGLRNGGTLQIGGNKVVDDAGQVALYSNWKAKREIASIEIEYPAEATTDSSVHIVAFDAFVTAMDDDLPQDADEVASFTASLKVASDVTESTA